MDKVQPTRRAALGILATPAIAMVPALAVMQCSAPADAMASARHPAWLVEANHLRHHIDTAKLTDEQGAVFSRSLVALEDRILCTPALDTAEAVAQIDLIATLLAEGSIPTGINQGAILRDAVSILRRGVCYSANPFRSTLDQSQRPYSPKYA